MENIKHATSHGKALTICSWYEFVPYKHKDTDKFYFMEFP